MLLLSIYVLYSNVKTHFRVVKNVIYIITLKVNLLIEGGGAYADSWNELSRIVNNEDRENKSNGESVGGEEMERWSWRNWNFKNTWSKEKNKIRFTLKQLQLGNFVQVRN